MSQETKEKVREFYDKVGWIQQENGLYQNARYEDMRPVTQEYIHKTRLRVNRYLPPKGKLLLDAGSGPVQYPEYLTYSEHYQYRVCADISITALKEARKRLGEKGLYVVADIVHLPFAENVFDGVVSMHTIHHLPLEEHGDAYRELTRVLLPGGKGVVINGWTGAPLMAFFEPLIRLGRALRGLPPKQKGNEAMKSGRGTFVQKMNAKWLTRELEGIVPFRIFAWRSLSTRFLRWLIHPHLGGKAFLRLVFWMEDRFPRFFGVNGQYPLILIEKPISTESPSKTEIP
jgi:SAM-dependent methyltransferase